MGVIMEAGAGSTALLAAVLVLDAVPGAETVTTGAGVAEYGRMASQAVSEAKAIEPKTIR